MVRFIAERILAIVPVMVIVSLIVFAMVRLTGDPAAIIAGDLATSQQLAAIHHSMGLDQPLYVQFYIWLRQLVHGNLGVSLSSQIPVTALIVQRLGPTLALSIGTIVLSVCAGVPLGILAAARPGSWLDRGVVAFSAFGFSVPGFITGYIVIQIFALSLRALPVQGYEPLRDGIWPFIEHLILPVLALSASYVALIIRITRTSILEVVNEDFIRTARAKGQSERGVFLGHALRNAAVPIVTVIGTGLAVLIGGVVVTESVFNIPGLGRLVVDAVLSRDFPVIQGLILLFSLTYVVVNLFVDLTYTVIDPRIRY